MNETGFRFLERLYPRSVLQAAIHGAGKAACEIHDQAIGRRGVHHLFRLPTILEDKVRECLVLSGSKLLAEFRPKLSTRNHLVAVLADLGAEPGAVMTGPQRMGTASELNDRVALSRMAGVYSAAFGGGAPVYPYFEVGNGSKAQ
jgi:hypothetical protein